jgi:hypothetical protein
MFKTGDIVQLLTWKRYSPYDPEKGKCRILKVLSKGKYGKILVSNLNMPFSGIISEIVFKSELKK